MGPQTSGCMERGAIIRKRVQIASLFVLAVLAVFVLQTRLQVQHVDSVNGASHVAFQEPADQVAASAKFLESNGKHGLCTARLGENEHRGTSIEFTFCDTVGRLQNSVAFDLTESIISLESLDWLDDHRVFLIGAVNPSLEIAMVVDIRLKSRQLFYGYGFEWNKS